MNQPQTGPKIFQDSVGWSAPCRGCKAAGRKLKNGISIKLEETDDGWSACPFCDVPQQLWSKDDKVELM